MRYYKEVEINLAEFQKCNVECSKQIAQEMACSHFFKVQKQAKLNNVLFGDTYGHGKRKFLKFFNISFTMPVCIFKQFKIAFIFGKETQTASKVLRY